MRAADLPTEEDAILSATLTADYVLRRWLVSLARLMNKHRGFSKQALFQAQEPLLKMIDRRLKSRSIKELDPTADDLDKLNQGVISTVLRNSARRMPRDA